MVTCLDQQLTSRTPRGCRFVTVAGNYSRDFSTEITPSRPIVAVQPACQAERVEHLASGWQSGQPVKRTTTMERTRWIPLSDALAELGVSRSTFDDWRRQGVAPETMKLPSGKLRVSRQDLDAFIADCVENAA